MKKGKLEEKIRNSRILQGLPESQRYTDQLEIHRSAGIMCLF